MAGDRLGKGPVDVHRNVLKERIGGKQVGERTLCRRRTLLPGTAVVFPNLVEDIGRHANSFVIPPHRRIRTGLAIVPRKRRFVLQAENCILQGGRDHNLVRIDRHHASAEDSAVVLEEQDAPAGIQSLDDIYAVSMTGLSRKHRVAVDDTERAAAYVLCGVEPSAVLARDRHEYILKGRIRALHPYLLRIRAEDAYPKFMKRQRKEGTSILSDKNCEVKSDLSP